MIDAQNTHRARDGKRGDPTREKLKAAARRLFSVHGVDGVSVRDIVRAAGARNGASLHYHFGSKEGLIAELVQEGARRSERGRQIALNALEARGGARRAADIVRLLAEVEIGRHSPPEDSPGRGGLGHMRFIVALQTSHRNLMRSVLDGEKNTVYLVCLDLLRALLPKSLSEEIVNQRLIFMYLLLTNALAARETAFETDPTGGKLWSSPRALENLIASIAGMLEAPPVA